MFMNLMHSVLADSTDPSDSSGIVDPPPSYVPPLGASRATWPNIMKNKGNIDYCVDQFFHLMNRFIQMMFALPVFQLKLIVDVVSFRIKCIDKLTGGPFLN